MEQQGCWELSAGPDENVTSSRTGEAAWYFPLCPSLETHGELNPPLMLRFCSKGHFVSKFPGLFWTTNWTISTSVTNCPFSQYGSVSSPEISFWAIWNSFLTLPLPLTLHISCENFFSPLFFAPALVPPCSVLVFVNYSPPNILHATISCNL